MEQAQRSCFQTVQRSTMLRFHCFVLLLTVIPVFGSPQLRFNETTAKEAKGCQALTKVLPTQVYSPDTPKYEIECTGRLFTPWGVRNCAQTHRVQHTGLMQRNYGHTASSNRKILNLWQKESRNLLTQIRPSQYTVVAMPLSPASQELIIEC